MFTSRASYAPSIDCAYLRDYWADSPVMARLCRRTTSIQVFIASIIGTLTTQENARNISNGRTSAVHETTLHYKCRAALVVDVVSWGAHHLSPQPSALAVIIYYTR